MQLKTGRATPILNIYTRRTSLPAFFRVGSAFMVIIVRQRFSFVAPGRALSSTSHQSGG